MQYKVRLMVTMLVHAEHPNDAKRMGRDWLKGVLYAATRDSPYPLVQEADRNVPSEEVEEYLYPSVDEIRRRDEAEVVQRRQSQIRYELLKRVSEAKTTADYLAIQPEISLYARGPERFYDDPLVSIGWQLETLENAMRFCESHPNGPHVWKLSDLLLRLKHSIAREYDLTRQALGLANTAAEPNSDDA
jgi:hypothetical protein